MPFTPADTVSLALFCCLGAVLFGGAMLVFHRTRQLKLWGPLYVGAIVIASVLALTGVTESNMMPVAPMLMGAMIALGAAYAMSPSGRRLAQCGSFAVLLGAQCFRLPFELILHTWAEQGTVPSTMTWTGSNWDIIAGVLALIAIPIAHRSRMAAWVFQLIMFGLLLNVFRVVVLSSPFPMSWDLEQPLVLAAHFPYVLIVPLFVVPAFALHLVTFRKLLTHSEACN